MPRVPPPSRSGPRKSNASTPGPGDDGLTLADKLNYYDTPRPFKSHTFISKLPARTASAATTGVKKNVKQILVLERERVSGGDGFLSAAQTAAKARGEVVELGTKKKKPKTELSKRGLNLKGRGSRISSVVGSGAGTPMTEDLESGQTTPVMDETMEEKVEMALDNGPRKEIITYHTPTAPPSLLPAKKYCDITGLHASYTDPRTKLRYKGLEVWNVVRNLGPGVDQAYLALRGAQTSLK
ncbi:hypothetical protein BD324DRAFT_627032 [Kockovaella imperatae]|uniref:Vps72/YL1 C-terminal domain-containing protein n=1 Tax=Kockovaella imperatae TaxID=4999 RepID=A0A1Y1UFF8_9TREE|nr:hypothetical protein BD324DRAFT_627032 [Kockovaella imperatae]ORX36752.1 hypothetical protein BD324DRAFT_627032 [Kockovaella imperatae]